MPDLILLGPRGSGKTTVGRVVAERLGMAFVDLDEAIQHAAGRSIREIFADDGETGFRNQEAEALKLSLQNPGVLATGGGIVTVEENRRLLRDIECLRVLLLADPAILYARIAADVMSATTRPALTEHPGLDEVRHLLALRLPWYREVATHEVNVEGNMMDVVDAVLAVLHRDAGT